MNRITFFIIALVFSSTIFSRVELSGADKAEVLKVLKQNESLHTNFFTYNAKLVEEDAAELKKIIDGLKNSEFQKLLKDTSVELGKIKAANKREDNNITYHKVSLGLIKLIEKYNPGARYNSYSCPMVAKKWVQNSTDMLRVHNPYAPEMPHCGQRDTDYNKP